MNNIISTICFSLLISVGFTQTKIIAHKSHSGSKGTYFSGIPDNFGHAPEPFVMNSHLDSVIFVSDSVAVMVTSVCMVRRYQTINNGSKNSGNWRPGRDTVYHHPLFTQQHKLDSIKTVLNESYHFTNPMDSAVFIGFDNKTPKKGKRSSKGKAVKYTERKGNLYLLGFLLAGIGGVYAFSPQLISRQKTNRK